MIDLDTRMKIDNIIDDAYSHMEEIFGINENSPADKIYQTFRIQRNNPASYLDAYVHYYMGVFEGIMISLFLEEFDKYPIEEEQEFISNSFDKRWKSFVDVITEYAKKQYRKDNNLG